jgi:hypothetical protein
MIKVQAGQVQEGREMFARGIKGFPAPLTNVRSFLSFYTFKDQKVLKNFAEGFVKAGLPGEPDDFYRISSGNKLTEEELRKSLFGCKVTGTELTTGKQWEVERGTDGHATILEGDKSDSGRSWVEDGMLCDQWDHFYENHKDCWEVYRNPKGTPETRDEYLGAPGYGIYPFSVIE